MSSFNIVALALGLGFLYLPIVILVIYSFNASRLVTVWGGWSLAWYRELARDAAMLDAAWTSLRIAALSATAATVLGTCAAVALVRMERFRGRLLFSGMVYAPLVMPEVITGLSLLLLFIALNFDRGFWTVAIAHTTLTMCFVTIIVQSRLIGFDRSLEEAAMDLGAPPLKTFVSITLPLILPAVVSALLIAFTTSFDEYAVASFLVGTRSTFPIYLYSALRFPTQLPQVIAVAVVVLLVSLTVVVAAELGRRFAESRVGV
jgi:putrescine transport system permease protein